MAGTCMHVHKPIITQFSSTNKNNINPTKRFGSKDDCGMNNCKKAKKSISNTNINYKKLF